MARVGEGETDFRILRANPIREKILRGALSLRFNSTATLFRGSDRGRFLVRLWQVGSFGAIDDRHWRWFRRLVVNGVCQIASNSDPHFASNSDPSESRIWLNPRRAYESPAAWRRAFYARAATAVGGACAPTWIKLGMNSALSASVFKAPAGVAGLDYIAVMC